MPELLENALLRDDERLSCLDLTISRWEKKLSKYVFHRSTFDS